MRVAKVGFFIEVIVSLKKKSERVSVKKYAFAYRKDAKAYLKSVKLF